MRSTFAKYLFATLALACVMAAGSASDIPASIDPAAQPQALQDAATVKVLHVMAATSDNADTAVKQDATLLVATGPVPSDFALESAARHRDFAGRGAPMQVKSWMLVLIGIFLILAISHRRYRSMMD